MSNNAYRLNDNISERQLQKLIIDYIKLALPGCWWRNNIGGIGQRRGIPDLEVMYQGRPFFIEVKTPKGRLSPYQERELAWLKESGVEVLVARSLEDVVEFFEGVGAQGKLY